MVYNNITLHENEKVQCDKKNHLIGIIPLITLYFDIPSTKIVYGPSPNKNIGN